MLTQPDSEIAPTNRPKQRERIDEHHLNDEAVLYDVAHHATHYLNATARFIWEKCDGCRNVENITECVLENFEPSVLNDAATIRLDVLTTINALAKNGLIDLCPEGT